MKFEIYHAKDGCRWRLVASNGRIVADSGEAYKTEGNARRALKAFRKGCDSATVVVIKGEQP
jgi:uncharacterized protein